MVDENRCAVAPGEQHPQEEESFERIVERDEPGDGAIAYRLDPMEEVPHEHRSQGRLDGCFALRSSDSTPHHRLLASIFSAADQHWSLMTTDLSDLDRVERVIRVTKIEKKNDGLEQDGDETHSRSRGCRAADAGVGL